MPCTASLRRSLQATLSPLAAAACVLALCAPAGAETSAVPPVCVSPDYNEWAAHQVDFAEGIEGSDPGDIRLHVSYQVGVGATRSCAFQSKPVSYQVCTGPGGGLPCHAEYTYAPHVPVSAFPDTVDSAGGDHQTVQIHAAGATSVGWGSCFPGATYTPGYCDPSLFRYGTPEGFPYAGGQMLYRFRDATGHFSGNWTLSYGRITPGFRLEHTGMSACTALTAECDYDVIWTRDPLNHPIITKDAQVLLILDVGSGPIGQPEFVDSTIAVPMLVIQSGGLDPGPGGSKGPGSSPGGGSSGGMRSLVAPRASDLLAVGRPTMSSLRRRGTVSISVPVPAAGVTVSGRLTLGAARARSIGLAVPRGASEVVIGSARATAKAGGRLVLTLRLTRAARAAIGRAGRRAHGPRRLALRVSVTLALGSATTAPTLASVVVGR